MNHFRETQLYLQQGKDTQYLPDLSVRYILCQGCWMKGEQEDWIDHLLEELDRGQKMIIFIESDNLKIRRMQT